LFKIIMALLYNNLNSISNEKLQKPIFFNSFFKDASLNSIKLKLAS
jgi:hypothetical protein